MKLVHWPSMAGLLHLVQRGGPQPAQAPLRCTKCNRTPISGQCRVTVLLQYNGPLLCSFNVPVYVSQTGGREDGKGSLLQWLQKPQDKIPWSSFRQTSSFQVIILVAFDKFN